ncbi:MAG: motility associated factor glycosyltransferase family protein [Candidatus Protochlamydia sp.]|nr:motility associated factor glycosyltransferase family protein [Candidatus Protochlamydia sp.]
MKSKLTILKKNLELLKKKDAKLSYQLLTADPSALQTCLTEKGELNLTRIYEGQSFWYHSPSGAKEEAEAWFTHLNLTDICVLFIYGIGLGYYYAAAKAWLGQDKNRKLIFFEVDKGVLYRLFETKLGEEILRNNQVQIVYFVDLLEDKALFNEIAWTYLDCAFQVSALKLYEDANPEGFLELHHHLSYNLVERKAFVEEYLEYGIAFFRNFYPNLLELPKAHLGNALFAKFENVPAIICGAGPSLNKNIEQLKGLNEKALIFAGSSALNALIPNGILPHFGVAIDPNQAQLPRVKAAEPHKIPFFYRHRLFNEALKAISGPRLYLTGTGGYEISDWFEQELKIEGKKLDEGHNVVNFCVEIAHALGCNPIIFAGVDLAFTNEQHYAEGVAADLKLTENDFRTEEDFESNALLKEDINGQPIHTLWKWVTEAEWIADFAKEHPEITFINATEGGLGFKDVPNSTLNEVIEQHVQANRALHDQIKEAVKNSSLSSIQSEHVKELMLKMQASLDRCIRLLTQLKNESQELTHQIRQGLPYPESLQTNHMALSENEIEEEPGYQFILDTFNQIFMRVNLRKIQELQQPKRGRTTKKRALQKLQLQLGRLTFLNDTARINRELIQRAIREINS